MFLPEDYLGPCPSPICTIEPPAIYSWRWESQIRQSSTCESFLHYENVLGGSEALSPASSVNNTKTWAEFLHETKSRPINLKTGDKSSRSIAPRKRAIINAHDACEIFLLAKPSLTPRIHGHHHNFALAPGGDSLRVSIFFGISPKAVRDIWNR